MGKKEKEKKERGRIRIYIICYVHCYKSLIGEKRKERMLRAVRKAKET